jgi:ketosteroid isomerase-like protein
VGELDDDIALLERAFQTLATHFEAVRAGDTTLMTQYWDPDLRIENVDGWPVPGSYDGYDGFRRWFDETFGEYSGYTPERAQYTYLKDRIIAVVHSRWAGPDGEEVVPQVALRFQLRDGRIARMEVFTDEARARAAALD